MAKLVGLIALVAFVFAVTTYAADEPAKAAGCFVCDKCQTIAMEAGKCPKCGADMKAMHLLVIKDGNAYVCTCGAACKCKMGDDLTKCSCGKDIVKVALKGKFVCGCGPDCKCNTISDKAGKCGCGKDMVEVK